MREIIARGWTFEKFRDGVLEKINTTGFDSVNLPDRLKAFEYQMLEHVDKLDLGKSIQEDFDTVWTSILGAHSLALNCDHDANRFLASYRANSLIRNKRIDLVNYVLNQEKFFFGTSGEWLSEKQREKLLQAL